MSLTPSEDPADHGGAGRHLVLVGMMGVGKTTVGRRVAKRLGRPFFDADDELMARTGKTVAEWFAEDGEDAFRDAEGDLLADLLAGQPAAVIATGGGVVIRPANRQALQSGGVVVWLRAEPEFLATRVKQKAHRPLLADDLEGTLQRLHAERQDWYREVADATIEVGPVYRMADKPKKDLAQMVIDAVGPWGILEPDKPIDAPEGKSP